MERNCVTLETAKKLKAAGFPIDDNHHYLWWWESGYSGSRFVATENEVDWYRSRRLSDETHDYTKICIANTSQEIGDQLPRYYWIGAVNKNGLLTVKTGPEDMGNWGAAYFVGGDAFWTSIADTMAEALAALYLSLAAETLSNTDAPQSAGGDDVQ